MLQNGNILQLVFGHFKIPHLHKLHSLKNKLLLQRALKFDSIITTRHIVTSSFYEFRCLAALPDGLIACGTDCLIIVYDTKNNCKLIKNINFHLGRINSLLYIGVGKLISGSEDKTMKVWDLNDDYKCLQDIKGHSNGVSCLLLLPHRHLLSGSSDSQIIVWGRQDGLFNKLRVLKGHIGMIRTLMLLTGNYGFASLASDNTVRLWNYKKKYEYVILQDSKYDITCIVQLIDGNLATESQDMNIRIWDIKTYECIKTIKCKSYSYGKLVLPDG
jgi:WD40 repeat protein